MRRILCTMSDGSVAVMYPTLSSMKARTNGGGLILPYPVKTCIDNMIRNGRRPSFARRWVETALVGGMIDAEYYEALIEKDMPKGATAPELIDEAPQDRWFRNAWRRSHNGGPIYIDLTAAKRQQAQRVRAAVIEKQSDPLNTDVIDVVPLIERIKAAPDLCAVRSVWPP